MRHIKLANLFLAALAAAFCAQTAKSQGSVSGQASGVIPLATGPTSIGAQSHLDDGNTFKGIIASSEPIVATVPLVCTSTITTFSVSGGTLTVNYTGGNCSGNSALSPGATFVLTGITGGLGCSDVQFTVASNNGSAVTAQAGSCSGSGTGGNFATISPALFLCNAAANVGDNCVHFWLDPDGSLFQYVYEGTSTVKAALHLDTTGYADMYVAGAGGGGFHADANLACFPSQGAGDLSRATCYEHDGYVSQVRGQPICVGGATGNCVGFPPEYYTNYATETNDVNQYKIYTTLAGTSANDMITMGAAGVYELIYWAEATNTAIGVTLTASLSCVDPNGNRVTSSGPAMSFASPSAVAQGSVFCYSEGGQDINVSFIHAGPMSPSYNLYVSLWKR